MRLLVLALRFAPAAPAAHAYPQLPEPLPPVADNPADALAELPIEDPAYDRAEKCSKRSKPGVVDARAADRLFRLLLAPDRLRNPQALARRDHIHIGLSKDGAMARTSFWAGG